MCERRVTHVEGLAHRSNGGRLDESNICNDISVLFNFIFLLNDSNLFLDYDGFVEERSGAIRCREIEEIEGGYYVFEFVFWDLWRIGVVRMGAVREETWAKTNGFEEEIDCNAVEGRDGRAGGGHGGRHDEMCVRAGRVLVVNSTEAGRRRRRRRRMADWGDVRAGESLQVIIHTIMTYGPV